MTRASSQSWLCLRYVTDTLLLTDSTCLFGIGRGYGESWGVYLVGVVFGFERGCLEMWIRRDGWLVVLEFDLEIFWWWWWVWSSMAVKDRKRRVT